MVRARSVCLVVCVCFVVIACGGPEGPAGVDSGADGGGSVDAAARDAAGPDASCTTDADGDGARAIACGGNDCDDADADRFPGHTEVCDTAGRDEDCDPTTFGSRDADADGHLDATCCNGTACGDDCDDTRADVFTGTTETCDLRDDDCDGAVDEGVAVTVFTDADGDGYGVGAATTRCADTVGFATAAGDCDDTAVTRSPGATELCATGIDEDCDGRVDESGPRVFFRDSDGDGYGDPGDTIMSVACVAPAGYADNSRDCADASPAIHPGAVDTCNGLDDDCSIPGSGGGELSEDRDMDGHAPPSASCVGGYPMDDCNDGAAFVFGGAIEVCDGLDDDCSSGGGAAPDEDMDGDLHAPILAACIGGTYPRDDCRDDSATIYAGAVELCDGLDDDCSSGGGVEPGEDADGDLHARIGALCIGGPIPRDDCDDAAPLAHPGATELCDGRDTDCSSGGGPLTAEDADGDLHASPAAACSGGFARDDCDDTLAFVYAGAPELCDRLDDDCSVGGGVAVAEDADADGYAGVAAACSGGALPRTDCVDSEATIHPGAAELCNRIDDDCSTGGGVEPNEDADLDGYADLAAACSGGTLPRTDCVDTSATIHPGASELCDRLDYDCSNGGGAEPGEDLDDDLHAAPSAACAGGPRPKDDCDDSNASVYPGAPLAAPRLLAPENGSYTGSLHGAARGTLRPTFRWSLASCSPVTYDVAVDDSCATPGFATCALPSPEHTVTGIAALTTRPASDLAVSALAPVGRRYYWRARACAGATCGPWSMIRYVEVGRAPSDLNGDGRSDVVVGAPVHAGGGFTAGSVYVYDGSASGIPTTPTRTINNPTGNPFGRFGWSVTTQADVNADGYADLLVGARSQSAGASGEGNAFVYLGGAGGVGVAPSIVLDSPTNATGTRFGWVVTSAGDVNADGYADVAIGQDDLFQNGAAYVFHGSATGIPIAPTTTLPGGGGGSFGWSLASAGDVDADGFSDLLVGAPIEAGSGSVSLHRGSASGISTTRAAVLRDPELQASARFGASITSAGDVNGDGYADIAVGADTRDAGATDEGNVLVYLGTPFGPGVTPALTIDSPANEGGAHFGRSVASCDLDADGRPDLVVGADLADLGASDEGNAFVYSGGSSGLPSAPSRVLDDPLNQLGAAFGWTLASAGDVDGDGYGDLIVGAPQADAGAVNEGNAFIYHGSATGVPALPSVTLDSPANAADDTFGYSVASRERSGRPARRGCPWPGREAALAFFVDAAARPRARLRHTTFG